ncbi:MAG: hypothetical protein JW738_08255 [Actinobacteria bacterium]|nr:hypothetical protein [Actinomycetota bacterium]
MSGEVGIIDAREWQTAVDMKSGCTLESIRPQWEQISRLIDKYPYPGDLSGEGNQWVVDVATEVVQLFDPSLVFLLFANQSFRALFGGIDDNALAADLNSVAEHIEKFVISTGYEPFIIGTGGFCELKGFMNLMSTDGLALGGGVPGGHLGIYSPSPKDLDMLRSDSRVSRLVSREEFRSRFGGNDCFYERFPDYYIELEDGYVARSVYGLPRNPDRSFKLPWEVPLSTHLKGINDLTDIRPRIESAVNQGRKIAVVLVEGWDLKNMPLDFEPCNNHDSWLRHGLKTQCHSIFTGKSFTESVYPPIFKCYNEDDIYPFSFDYSEPEYDTLGQTAGDLSVAIGNRSIIPHSLFGADITIECFARCVQNFGNMAVIKGRGLELLS